MKRWLSCLFLTIVVVLFTAAIVVNVIAGMNMMYTQFPCNITSAEEGDCYKPNTFRTQYWYRQKLIVNGNISAELNCYDDDWCDTCRENYSIGIETICYMNREVVILGYCCPFDILIVVSIGFYISSLLLLTFYICFRRNRVGYENIT